MATKAKIGKGVALAFSTTANGTFTPIAEITKLSGPSPKGTKVKVTNSDSPDGWEETIPGLTDGGDLKADLNYDKTQFATLYGLHMTPGFWKVTKPDGATYTLGGFITEIGDEVPIDGAMTNSITISVSTKPVFTPTPA